jgi:hypothetical protein
MEGNGINENIIVAKALLGLLNGERYAVLNVC